eukprot:gnl/MRDRNA2_/MRDRNA2_99439_c0_seq1.p1 gnl/MRDRNA2_/MRDRNA2_99439_c0~~gnl/MRDRNA2_/MRDRNA2_99439_c0_seq1.p1  ORF type:complete len:546 (+),score=77.46 gnl/MRDRNA2_/MRDRNA2_99439_c0_seq1:86-1723(+)
MFFRKPSTLLAFACSVAFLIQFCGMSYLLQAMQGLSGSRRMVQSTTISSSRNFRGAMEPDVATKLADWVTKNGGFIGNLKAANGLYGRAVVAAADIPKGQVVIRIPMSIAITPSVYNGSMPRNFSKWSPLDSRSLHERWIRHKQHLRGPPNETSKNDWNRLALAAYISAHAFSKSGNSSDFSLYFDSIPAPKSGIWSNMPRFWTQEQLAVLNGSQVGEALSWDQARFQYLFDVAHENNDWQLFQWALAVISSRAFSVTFSRHNTFSVLLPWADLLNENVTDPHVLFNYNKEVDAMEFISQRHIFKGEEVTTSYGPHSNLNLLRSYGFTYPEITPNPQVTRYSPAARFTLTPAGASHLMHVPSLEEKDKFLTSQDNIRSDFAFLQFVDESQFYNMLRYARFLMLPSVAQEELDKAGCQVKQGIFGCQHAIDFEHEDKSLRLLDKFMHMKLGAYPTSLEEDEHMLATEEKQWKVNALRLIRDEKRPFAYIQQIVQGLIALQKVKNEVTSLPFEVKRPDCAKATPRDGETYWKCQIDRIVSNHDFGNR